MAKPSKKSPKFKKRKVHFLLSIYFEIKLYRMEPAAKKLKLENNQPVEQEESEPQWIRYEDLADSDIDDEYGDMVIVPKLLVNNEVK